MMRPTVTALGLMSGTSMDGIDAAILTTDGEDRVTPGATLSVPYPEAGRTWQLGDGAQMASALGCRVVNRFRDNDLRQSGQGAPLAPAYHRAIVRAFGLAEPIAVLNIGGVSNLTWIRGEATMACDCGPGNALIDDWVRDQYHLAYDEGGAIAGRGVVDFAALGRLMSNP